MLGFTSRWLSNSNEGENALNRKRKVAQSPMQTDVNQSSPRGARAGLFIGEVKSLITMP
jgi:hypothetical protein